MYLGLGITDPEVFDDLLTREDGRYENEILKFLNETPKEGCTMIFYSMLKEEEEEIEVEAGMCTNHKLHVIKVSFGRHSLFRRQQCRNSINRSVCVIAFDLSSFKDGYMLLWNCTEICFIIYTKMLGVLNLQLIYKKA